MHIHIFLLILAFKKLKNNFQKSLDKEKKNNETFLDIIDVNNLV